MAAFCFALAAATTFTSILLPVKKPYRNRQRSGQAHQEVSWNQRVGYLPLTVRLNPSASPPRDELNGLTENKLISDQSPNGITCFSMWLETNKEKIGRSTRPN